MVPHLLLLSNLFINQGSPQSNTPACTSPAAKTWGLMLPRVQGQKAHSIIYTPDLPANGSVPSHCLFTEFEYKSGATALAPEEAAVRVVCKYAYARAHVEHHFCNRHMAPWIVVWHSGEKNWQLHAFCTAYMTWKSHNCRKLNRCSPFF